MHHLLSISLRRPFLQRWAHDLAESIVCAWQQRRARRELNQRIDAMADLSEAVLRDIGGSDDLLRRAAARSQAHAECVGDMRMLANHRHVDTRFW